MTQTDERFPPDDFVIGETYPPAPAPVPSGEGQQRIGETPADRWSRPSAPVQDFPDEPQEDAYDEDVYDDEEYDEQAYDVEYVEEDARPAIGAGYYYDDWEDEPQRQPIFYVFIGIAVLLGALFVFLLFNLIDSGGDDETPIGPSDPEFNIQIDSPINGERVQVDEDLDVFIRANSNEQIVRIELLADDEIVDIAEFATPPEDGIYSPTLVVRFPRTGSYELMARAVSESGATKESAKVPLNVVELVDDQPATLTGEVITTVNARTGPGEQFPTARTYDAGDVVTLVGRSPEDDWLLMDDDLWIRRAALRLSDSPALLPVRRPTPTPAPTATPTPEPSETATPGANAPDLSPVNATLSNEGNALQVSIRNLSANVYDGPVVVAVVGLPSGDLQEAFVVSIPAGATRTVPFELPEPNTEGGSVDVTVDVGDNIEESNEDNNTATFILSPPAESPELQVSAQINGDNLVVTVTNVGGQLNSSTVRVSVTLNGTTSTERTIALASNQAELFNVLKPAGPGVAEIRVFVNDVQVASGSIEIPGAETPEPSPTTET
jgi:hypothetical protein